MSEKDRQSKDVAEVVQVEVVADNAFVEEGSAQVVIDPDLIYEVCSYETVLGLRFINRIRIRVRFSTFECVFRSLSLNSHAILVTSWMAGRNMGLLLLPLLLPHAPHMLGEKMDDH